MTIQLYKLNFTQRLIVSHCPAKFSGHKLCGSRDIIYLIYQVTLQDHTMKVSCDFKEGSSLLYVTTMASLATIDIHFNHMVYYVKKQLHYRCLEKI